ncbi:hypothetical protein [Paenibacillus larvae]|uniref:hypothetical protein n=1 Tax=Paenibacillus larvae TaxID=1464 RepID=UPI0028F4022A|nr:hypothetical protein [Paenibacillus larvae]
MSKDCYFVHESSYVDAGASIGSGTKIWHFSHVMEGAEIGENCILGQNVFVAEEYESAVVSRSKIMYPFTKGYSGRPCILRTKYGIYQRKDSQVILSPQPEKGLSYYPG